MSFETEMEAFAELQKLLGDQTVQLIDTYDPIEGAREAAKLGRPLWGVRIDNGDLFRLSREVRRILDAAGLTVVLKDHGQRRSRRIAHRAASSKTVRRSDAFGVGTELATSADAPSTMGAIYKLVELQTSRGTRATAKDAGDKSTVPGAKQIFRFADRDVVGPELHECYSNAEKRCCAP